MAWRAAVRACGVGGILAVVAGCTSDDGAPARPARGSIGEELYGVVCDRVGAQALPEDLTGASYRDACHRSAAGTFATAVDESRLPPNADDAERATRVRAVARIGALIRRREDLVAALDALFPTAATLQTFDGPNPDGSPGCAPSGTRTLGEELAAMLSRMAPAYDDDTVPHATRALGRLMQSFASRPDAQAALARLGTRAGYRPASLALGATRPVLAYPGLRGLLRAWSAVLSPDVDPYAVDATGAHVATPGSAYPRVTALSEVASYALRAAKPSPAVGVLRTTPDATLGLDRLSRPRTSAEIAARILSTEDGAFGPAGGPFIVRRDPRGVAQVATSSAGAIAAPFVDSDGDGLADLDPLGRFVLQTGAAAPTPFFDPATPGDTAARDPSGRALLSGGGPLAYAYMDTSRTFGAALLRDAKAWVDPDPSALHETLMDLAAGAYVAIGPRDGAPLSTRSYALDDGTTAAVTYDAVHADASPLLDLAYAGGQLLADADVDATLATTSWLFESHAPELAEAVNAALAVKAVADAHPEASLPARSTLWDDVLDVVARIAEVDDADGSPGLVADLLAALADDATAPLGDALGALLENEDAYDYDRNDHNGPSIDVSTGVLAAAPTVPVDRSQPLQGPNRSLFHRFLQLVHDTRGVSVCNREGARVEALFKGLPVLGDTTISIPDNPLVTAFWGKSSFHECEVFKMDDMAVFYVQSIVGQARYVLRDKQLRDGVAINLGVTSLDVSQTATTVKLLEDSSDITGWQPPGTSDPSARTGFWTGPTSKDLMTRPEWLNRNLFFPNGYPASAPKPARADAFSKALNPDHAGTSKCPTRDVKDPLDPSDPNYTPGGVIHLPACADGDWLDQRDAQTIFALETTGFYPAIAPLVKPFVDRGRADLLVALLDALYAHWGEETDGAAHYEPIVAAAVRQVLPPLRQIAKALVASGAPTPWLACATRDASGACVGASVPPVRALASAVRGAVSPREAARRGLVDRRGGRSALRNDGTTNPQVTPVYLVTAALSAIDAGFDGYAAAHPADAGRLVQWRRARSQLVDRLLATDGTSGWRFVDAAVPAIAPRAIEALRQQLDARCPEWPGAACAWAGTQLTADLADTVGGPVFARALDLLDALRADEPSRREAEKLATYLLADGSGNDALVSLLATSDDLTQALNDETDLVPIGRAVGAAMAAPPGERSLLDANLALLTRLTAPARDAAGGEACGREIDPNQVLTRVLEQAVTPMTSGRTPIEVIFDVIGDVNRSAPEITGALTPGDCANVADQVAELLLDEQRGLEQFYAIVRNATR
jgi:hypothetical protein